MKTINNPSNTIINLNYQIPCERAHYITVNRTKLLKEKPQYFSLQNVDETVEKDYSEYEVFYNQVVAYLAKMTKETNEKGLDEHPCYGPYKYSSMEQNKTIYYEDTKVGIDYSTKVNWLVDLKAKNDTNDLVAGRTNTHAIGFNFYSPKSKLLTKKGEWNATMYNAVLPIFCLNQKFNPEKEFVYLVAYFDVDEDGNNKGVVVERISTWLLENRKDWQKKLPPIYDLAQYGDDNEPSPCYTRKNCKACDFKSACAIDEFSLVSLSRDWKKVDKIMKERDSEGGTIPNLSNLKPYELEQLDERDRIIAEAHIKNEVYINKEKLKDWFENVLCKGRNIEDVRFDHIDFEALTILDGNQELEVLPNEYMPFSYSLLHAGIYAGTDLSENQRRQAYEIDTTHKVIDPTKDKIDVSELFANSLVYDSYSDILVASNIAFEVGILDQLGRRYPAYQDKFTNMAGNLVDLQTPFEQCWYYNPTQKGKYGLKAVYKALVGNRYDELDINNGEQAMVEYKKHWMAGTKDEKLFQDIQKYNDQDVIAQAEIIDALYKLIYES